MTPDTKETVVAGITAMAAIVIVGVSGYVLAAQAVDLRAIHRELREADRRLDSHDRAILDVLPRVERALRSLESAPAEVP